MATSPLFKTKQEEAIVTFICENESQWDKDHWDSFRRLVACGNFGVEYGKHLTDKKVNTYKHLGYERL